MRHIYIIFLLFISQLVSAQESANSNTEFSITLGFNASKDQTYSDSYNDYRFLFTPTVSINYYHPIKYHHWLNVGLTYYQIGDVYYYYTGNNRDRDDFKIFVNTIKIPVQYTALLTDNEKINIYTKVGPSLDFVIGQSNINPKRSDAFRSNIGQGEVIKNKFILFNASAGILLKENNEIETIIGLTYLGYIKGIYAESKNGNGQSEYHSISLNLEIFF